MAKGNSKSSNLSENYLSLGLGILVVVVIGALIFNYISNRGSQKGEISSETEQQVAEEQKGKITLPTTHKVVQGEDLWKISEQYFKTGYNWTDIAEANNLTDPNNLLADTELKIPDVQPKVLPATGEVSSVKTEVQPVSNAIADSSYTVVRGDSLWKVAVRAYGDGYKWVEIAKANGLANPDLIHAGNVLQIPR